MSAPVRAGALRPHGPEADASRPHVPERRAPGTHPLARLLPALLLLAIAGCDLADTPTDPPLDPTLDALLRATFSQYGVIPIGAVAAQDPALVELGQALLFDPILSGNRDVSCATCHLPALGATDGRSLPVGTGATGEGHARMPGPDRDFLPRNAPTLLNQGHRPFYLFWDGRLSGQGGGFLQAPPGVTFPQGLPTLLAAQAMLPVLDRGEMRGRPGDTDIFGEPNELAEVGDDDPQGVWRALTARLLAEPAYVELFAAAFPDVQAGNLGFHHAATAIAAFIAEAFTKADSPFDRYLAGDDRALSPAEKRGAARFFGVDPNRTAGSGGSLGAPVDPFPVVACSNCHSGPLLGGQSFANVGAPQIGPGRGTEPPLDLGRGEVDPQLAQHYRFLFRTPPLRNVELTAPYMHSGAYATLEEVVRHYDDVPEALRSYDPAGLEPGLRDRVHQDEATVEALLERLDFRVREPLELSDAEADDLVAFLRALTDPAARNLEGVVPETVPSGLPMR